MMTSYTYNTRQQFEYLIFIDNVSIFDSSLYNNTIIVMINFFQS